MAEKSDFLERHPWLLSLKLFFEEDVRDNLLVTCQPDDWCSKSTSESLRLRNLGNESYRSKKYEEAVMYYSLSVAAAPTDSAELSLAYGNRSMVLWVLKDYELCLLDSNRALNGSIPESSRAKIMERKAASWERLQAQNDVRSRMRSVILNTKCKGQDMSNLASCVGKVCYVSQMGMDDTDLVVDYSLVDASIWETKFDNVLLPNVTSKMELRCDEKWGRHFTATKDIEPGEVLFINDFYSIKTFERRKHNYCSYCTVWCDALIPCPSCSLEMYCCMDCREKAYQSYHRTECALLPFMSKFNPEERMRRLSALRMFLIGTKQGKELMNLMNDPKVYDALNGKLNCVNAAYSLEDYLSMLNFHWQIDENAYDDKNCLVLSDVLATLIPLRCVPFFGDGKSITQGCDLLTDEEVFTTLLLAHHFSLSTHYYFTCDAYFFKALKGPLSRTTVGVGTAMGSWTHFMNHSCDPNTMLVIDKRRILMCTVRPIKPGEQIFTNNGPSYSMKTLLERKKYLVECHKIECSCRPCVEDWPIMPVLLTTRNKYRTINKTVIGKIENMQEYVRRRMYDSLGENDLKKILDFVKTIRSLVYEPSATIFRCELFIFRLLKIKGNLYFTPKSIAALYVDFD